MTSMCFHDINNLLHDARNALKNCYIISKSWISQNKKHLYARVAFNPEKPQSRKATSLDLSSPPARYVRPMFIAFSQAFIPVDAEGGGLVPTLPYMVCLTITMSPFSRPTHSRLLLDLSVSLISPSHHHTFSVSFIHSLSSRTCL